ncbi:MAG: hypothetical protein KAJ01_01690, partial [Candidatus Hydrogenedentes bacterium]|nr:hypothetical protein [Candidatus Hydrogenedentota bacterium]
MPKTSSGKPGCSKVQQVWFCRARCPTYLVIRAVREPPLRFYTFQEPCRCKDLGLAEPFQRKQEPVAGDDAICFTAGGAFEKHVV